jgi:putative ABC transport system permease protein
MRRFGSLWQELRLSVRVLAKNPAATTLSLVSIAVGIGITTALFSFVDATYLRSMPFERPGDVLKLESRGDDGRSFLYNWPDYQDMVRAAQGVADLSAYQRRAVMLAGDEGSQLVLAYPVTSNHFSFLGVKAELGNASLEAAAGRPAAVVGYHLWRRRFGGDPGIVGKTILLNGKAFAVAGVMPREFTGLNRMVPNDIWVSTEAWFETLGNGYERQRDGQFEVIARLKPGVTAERAAAQLDGAIRGAGKHKPAPSGAQGTYLQAPFALDWRQQLTAGAALLLILGLILFVGCANAAQVKLAQTETRKKELGIRRALGASAWSVARLLLVETSLVCLGGAGLGLLLAQWLMDAVNASISGVIPYMDAGIRLDHRALMVSLAATLACVLLAGLAPVRQAARLDVNEVLKAEQGVGGLRTAWRKRVLVAGQIAATVLFFGMAVQFIENAQNAAKVRPGFDPGKQMFVTEVGRGWRWPAAKWSEQASARLAAVPGVRAVTYARRLPLSGSGGGLTARVELPGQAPLGVKLNSVGGQYFSVMGTRVLAGRGIEPNDREGGPLVAVVSQTFTRQVFGERNPVGEWISIDGKMRQVVGVAEDGPSSGSNVHEAPAPYLYLPYAQAPSGDLTLMIETFGDPKALGPAILRELKKFDPGVSVFSSTTLREHMDQALFTDRLAVSVASGLGAIGLLLTAAGLFGVIQYGVSRRTREIGLRVALGARPADVQRMILLESLRISAWGIPIGLLLLWAAARSVQSLLLGVTALDPLAYAASSALAVAIALAAAWLPAMRAARVDPLTALRSE